MRLPAAENTDSRNKITNKNMIWLFVIRSTLVRFNGAGLVNNCFSPDQRFTPKQDELGISEELGVVSSEYNYAVCPRCIAQHCSLNEQSIRQFVISQDQAIKYPRQELVQVQGHFPCSQTHRPPKCVETTVRRLAFNCPCNQSASDRTVQQRSYPLVGSSWRPSQSSTFPAKPA